MATPIDIRPNSLAAWGVAVRPKTLPIAAVPVLVAAALAWSGGARLEPGLVLLILIGSLLMQVITNLQNDVGYTLRLADSEARIGLPRATSKGWLSIGLVRKAILAVVLLVMMVGLPLVWRGGLPVLLLGLASVAAALGYMGGPRPIAYTPLGELTVFIFFGLAAVVGSTFLITGRASPQAWLAGAALGSHAAAVLAVNNHRDVAHDRRTGRRTYAALHGPVASGRLFGGLIFLPFLLLPAIAWRGGQPLLLLPLLALVPAVRLHRRFRVTPPGAGFTPILFATVRLEVVFGLLLAAGATAGRALGWR